MNSISPIKLNLSERLEKDSDFRKRFFRGQAQDEVASIIISLRKARKKRQIDLAKEAGMKQSAISRIEQADYSGWTLNTLFRVADALNARLRVMLDPTESIIEHYRKKEAETGDWQSEYWTLPAQQTAITHELARNDLNERALENSAAASAAIQM